MRRILPVAPTVALLLLWAAFPARAQRGGGHASYSGHGGFSGHTAPSFNGGFSAPSSGFHGSFSPGGFRSPSRSSLTILPGYNFRVPGNNEFRSNEFRFNAPQRNFLGRQTNIASRFMRTDPGNSFGHQVSGNWSHHRAPYRPPYQGNHGHGVHFYSFWPGTYGFFGYPSFYQYPPWWAYGDSNEDQGYPAQSAPPQDYLAPSMGDQQPDSSGLPPWPSLNPQEYPPSLPPANLPPPPQTADAVTLVFNDGRPPVRIHNYLLTSGTVYVMDQQRREIPVSELDLAATAKVNREAGISFILPR